CRYHHVDRPCSVGARGVTKVAVTELETPRSQQSVEVSAKQLTWILAIIGGRRILDERWALARKSHVRQQCKCLDRTSCCTVAELQLSLICSQYLSNQRLRRSEHLRDALDLFRDCRNDRSR